MSSPGSGNTNQAQTIAAFKRLLGKANTSALKESYEETIPSNIQIDTSTIFGEAIPQDVNVSSLYTKFSASNSSPVTTEYVQSLVLPMMQTLVLSDLWVLGLVMKRRTPDLMLIN